MTTRPVVEITLVPTGVAGVSAAHVMVGGSLVTVVWPTVPAVCVDQLFGDVADQGLVCQAADEPLFTWVASYDPGRPRRWWAVTAHWCETCELPPGPWAVAEPGHLVGNELVVLASEMAGLAEGEPELPPTRR